MKKTKHPPNPRLHGIIVPMVTPLLDRDTLDLAGLERLIEHILAGGVDGIFLLGSTGEAPSLSHALQCELVQRTCALVAGRRPVLVGITDTSFTESVRLAHAAQQAGARAVVLAPPFYFQAGQAEVLEYLQHLKREFPLPLYLYNLPGHPTRVLDPATVRAASAIPGIAGLKDSSGNMIYLHKVRQIMQDRPDFSLFVGPEELLAESVLLGCNGGVNGGANLFPRLYVDLYRAAKTGNLAAVRRLHAQVMRISTTLYAVGRHPSSSYLKGLKCALSCRGICSDFLAEPFHRFRKAERRRIEAHLKRAGL